MPPTTAIKVHPTADWTTRGSKHEHLPPTPLKGIILGPSGSGKMVVLVDMILRLYRGAWERIYIFSPSVHIDSSWAPVKDYIEKFELVPSTAVRESTKIVVIYLRT